MIARLSLRTFAVLLILFTLAPILAWSICTGHQARERMVDEARSRALLLVTLTARQQAQMEEQTRQLLSSISLFPSVQAFDSVHCSEVLALILSRYPVYDTLTVMNRHGEVVCSALPITGALNYADRSWFSQAVSQKTYVTGIFDVNPLTRQQVIQMALPFLGEDQQVQLVAVASLRLTWFQDLFKEVDLPENASISALNADGLILTRFPDKEQWAGQRIAEDPQFQAMFSDIDSGWLDAYYRGGESRLFTYAWAGSNTRYRLGFIASIPYESILAEANRIFYQNLLMQALVALVILALVYGVSQRTILDPMSHLVAVTRRFALGEWGARTGFQPGRNEFYQLGAAFDEMAATVQDGDLNFQRLIEHAPIGISIIQDRERLYSNPALAHMYGYETTTQMLGVELLYHVSPDDHAMVLEMLDRIEQGEPVEAVEIAVIRKDGVRFPALLQGTMLTVNLLGSKQPTVLAFIVDLTELKRFAEERERLLAELTEANRQMHRLSQKVIRAHEEERQRLSRELHDEAGQALTALKISLQIACDDVQPGQERLRERLEDSIVLSDETIDRIRRLAQELRPPALEMLGINQTLFSLCRNFSRLTGLPVTYEGLELPDLPDDIGLTLYRVLQEALTNVSRHSRASQVSVLLDYLDEVVGLTIKDDGLGFDELALDRQNKPGGIGLLGMRERVEMIQGRLDIIAGSGTGTQVHVQIPWEEGQG